MQRIIRAAVISATLTTVVGLFAVAFIGIRLNAQAARDNRRLIEATNRNLARGLAARPAPPPAAPCDSMAWTLKPEAD